MSLSGEGWSAKSSTTESVSGVEAEGNLHSKEMGVVFSQQQQQNGNKARNITELSSSLAAAKIPEQFLKDLPESPKRDEGLVVPKKSKRSITVTMATEPLTLQTLQRIARYTPLRLTEYERVLLGVVEGALDHSEFTSNVDVSASMHYVRETYDKDERVFTEVIEFCQVLLGLSAANDFKTRGKETLGDRLEDRASFFQHCLEVGRRFKIMNPGKCIIFFHSTCFSANRFFR
jgi:Protein of unknown function (DUF2009)